MDRNMFWDVIDSTNAAGPYPDQETWRCRMTAALEKHTMEEILDWQLILEEYMQSACRQDILAAAAARGVPCWRGRGVPERSGGAGLPGRSPW